MLLGQKDFLSGGSVDSDAIIPDDESEISFCLVANRNGTGRVYGRAYYTGNYAAVDAAVAVVSGEAGIFRIPFHVQGLFRDFILRFTDTSASAGSVEFTASLK